MLGKKSSLAPVLAFLTENDVGININFTKKKKKKKNLKEKKK